MAPSYRELGLVVNWLRESGMEEITYDEELVEPVDGAAPTRRVDGADLAPLLVRDVLDRVRKFRGGRQV